MEGQYLRQNEIVTNIWHLKYFILLNCSCWIHESAFSLILMVPVMTSLCINFVFLVSILRVLLLKIKTNTCQGQNRSELIKVFRAAFVLVPLLGLHYIIVCFRPENDEFWERCHEILSAVSASYQVKSICRHTYVLFFLIGTGVNILNATSKV